MSEAKACGYKILKRKATVKDRFLHFSYVMQKDGSFRLEMHPAKVVTASTLSKRNKKL